jgi:hypothetical protein
MEFELVITFSEHLQIVSASNYSAVTNSNTLQFTTGHTKSSHSAVSSPVFAWWWITTMFSASILMFLLSGDCPRTDPCPMKLKTRDFFFQLTPCHHSPYVTSSLRRGWVCLLWIYLALSSVCVTHIACLTDSRPQSFLVLGLESNDHIFVLSILLCVLKWDLLFKERKGLTTACYPSSTGEWICWHSLSLIHSLLPFV